MINKLLKLIGILIIIKLGYRLGYFLKKYCLTKPLNLSKRYGLGSYAIITGASKGQGRQFALQLANRGFNLVLIGSENTQEVIGWLQSKYPKIKLILITKNFGNSFQSNFFNQIEEVINKLGDRIKILVNNVGYRTGSLHYEDMTLDEIKKCISVGTLVQSYLIKLVLPIFKKKKGHSAIINITAQCLHSTDGLALDPAITLPHLSVYEASNAFGFYMAKSVYQEIRFDYPQIDFLVITPGAVITNNTRPFLKNIVFAIKDRDYVENILGLLGNYQGVQDAYWGHSISLGLINLCPLIKSPTLKQVGKNISQRISKLSKYGLSSNKNI